MGFTPREVDAMSAWEFLACVTGYRAAHGQEQAGGGEGMSEARMRELGIL